VSDEIYQAALAERNRLRQKRDEIEGEIVHLERWMSDYRDFEDKVRLGQIHELPPFLDSVRSPDNGRTDP
jgi:hypothetical protein